MSDYDRLLEEQRQTNSLLRQSLGQRGTTSFGSDTTFARDSLNVLTRSVGAATEGFAGLVTGTATLTSTFNAANSIIGQFGTLGQGLSRIIGPLGGTFQQVNESVRKAADSGVYFGNNLGLYAESVAGARMNLQDFNDVVKYNSNSLIGLGLGADRSAKTFLDLAKGVQESDVGNQLKTTGVSAEFLNQVLLTSASARKFVDLNQTSSQNAIVASAVSLATEMDNIARLTGISRQEQQKDLANQIQKASVQAMLSQMSVTQQNNFIESLGALRKQGKNVQDLFEEISTGGIRSAEGAERAAALNIISGKLVPMLNEMARLDKSERPEDKARSEELRKQFELEFARGVSTKQVADTVMLNSRSTDRTMIALREMYQQGMPAATVDVQARRAAAISGKTVEEERDRILKEAGKDRRGEEISAEATAGRTINKMNILLQDVAAGAGASFKTLNTTVGSSIDGFKGLNEVLKPYKQTETTVGAGVAKAKSVVEEIVPIKTTPKSAKPADYEPVKQQRQDGSLGAVGKFIEDFGKGTPVILHGREGVITEKQFNDLFNGTVKGLQENTQSSLDKNIESLSKSQTSIKNEKPSLDRSIENLFSNVLGNIQNTIKVDSPTVDKNIENAFSGALGNLQSSIKNDNINIERNISSMFGGIQTGLVMELERTKSSIPTVENFESMFQQLIEPIKNKTEQVTQPPVASTPVQPTTSELKEELVYLNTQIRELVAYTADIVNNSSQQVRVTKRLSGNALA